MLKKLWSNFKIVFFIVIILMGWDLYNNDTDTVLTNFKETYIWILVIGPVLLRFYNWFTHMKQRAFNKGFNSSGKAIEKLEATVDKKTGRSKKKYEAIKAQTKDKEKNKKKRTENNPIRKEVSSTLSDEFFIPLYHYINGLPGKNLIRENTEEHLVSYAKVVNEELTFYQVRANEYNQKNNSKNEIASILFSSIVKIEILDMQATRRLRRLGAKIANQLTWQFVNAASSTVIYPNKNKAIGCKLLIHYINDEGVIMPATFGVPSNAGFMKEAVMAARNLKMVIESTEGWIEDFDWGFDTNEVNIESNDNESEIESTDDGEAIGFEDISIFMGDTKRLLSNLNMLSAEDNAVATAKLSAEMLAGALQKKDLELVVSSDSDE